MDDLDKTPTAPLKMPPDPPAPSSSTTAVAGPGAAQVTTTVKPGWSTSEHLLSLIAILLTAAFGSGLIPSDGVGAKLGAMGAITLTALGYTVVRGSVKTGAAPVLIVLLLGLGATQLTACSASTRQVAIQDAYALETTAGAALLRVAKAREAQIIGAATSEADGAAKLAAWRVKVDKAMADTVAIGKAIEAVAALDTEQSLANLLALAATLKADAQAIGVSL